ncbi:cytochrome P450 714C2-like [Rhodamnia argentea]|uniref:Cytochrome P450 714C2-like n=1 Tax=Rhodamnia argentea TaxID=178133 RepID=A0ABM3HZ27_9MYRT|nr:cytochrome P450 714C2-like [Rhodamnia argentea]
MAADEPAMSASMAMVKMAPTLILGLLGLVLIHAYKVFIWGPKRRRSKLWRQGIEGPPPSHLLLGNIPDVKKVRADEAQRARESRKNGGLVKMASTLILGLLGLVLIHAYRVFIWGPRRLRSKLRRQGIEGPPPSHLLLGNIPDVKKIRADEAQRARESRKNGGLSHAWPSLLFPHLQKWRTQYGPIFMYSAGHIQFLSISDVEMVNELSTCTSLSLGKPSYFSKDRGALLGQGILSSSGSTWAYQRKIIAPELYLDKVKGMVSLMVDSANSLIGFWESRIESGGGTAEIRIDDDLRSLSADIISRACFGSSYSRGKEIFLKLRELQQVMSHGSIGVAGMRYLPTKINRQIWKLDKQIRSMILEVVKARTQASYEKDLLQMILQGANNEGLPSNISAEQFIVDNCKNIYFAGHETTALTVSWCLMLLAAHPQWQARVRAEVLEIFGRGVLDSDKLRGMKTLTMVIHETLRLYPPAVFSMKEALEDIKFKGLLIPQGSNIQIPIHILHQLPEIWGTDAAEFKPERFARGISGACKSVHAYMPFGSGPRICAGQHFAQAELKVILSLILAKLSFSLSPSYDHSPAFRLVVEPGDGVILDVRKV